MGLFKRFSKEKPKPTKEELSGFKMRLAIGDDPNHYWQKQKALWDDYRFHKETAMELLRKLYKVKEVSTRGCYSKLEVWIYSSTGECKKSPIGEHVYMHHYGDSNPRKGMANICLACNKELKL